MVFLAAVKKCKDSGLGTVWHIRSLHGPYPNGDFALKDIPNLYSVDETANFILVEGDIFTRKIEAGKQVVFRGC